MTDFDVRAPQRMDAAPELQALPRRMGTTAMATAPQVDEDARAEEATQAFEAMFVQEIFKTMRRSMPSGSSDYGRQMFDEMFDEQIAREIAKAGLGLGAVMRADVAEKSAQAAPKGVDVATIARAARP